MTRRKAVSSLVLSGALVGTLAVGAAAQEEASGELRVLCTPEEPYCVAMVDAFQAETGIPTTFLRMSSGESLARLRAQAGNPDFDVWWGGPADGQIAAAAEGLLEPYMSPNAEVIAEGQKAEDGSWSGVYVGALGFCSNQAMLDELGVDVPDSWEDLLDPALKGNVAVAHPASSGTAYTTFYTNVTRLGEEAAMDYMKELHNNILQYTKSGSAPGRMAGNGEVAVAIIFSHDCVRNIETGMTDLVVSFPSEGTGYEIAGQALIKDAQYPENAQTWIDWALTAPAQEIGWRDPNAGAYQLPTNPDAEVSDKAVKLSEVTLVDYDFDAAGENRERLTQRFEDEIATEPIE